MAGKVWTEAEDSIIRESFGSMFPAEIAALLSGRTPRAVQHRLASLGLRRSPSEAGALSTGHFDAGIAARLGEPIADWLRRRYIAESASYRELCAELDVNTRTLIRWMRESGIEPISSSEAALRQMERNPEAVSRMLAPEPQRRRAIALAKWREENWRTYCTLDELRLYGSLCGAGLTPEPQHAVGSFNIDFAYPAAMLAVEYDPGWHKTKNRSARDAARDTALAALGWTVLRLDARTSISFSVNRVSDALQSLAAIQPR